MTPMNFVEYQTLFYSMEQISYSIKLTNCEYGHRMALSTGIFSGKLRIAKIITLYKKDNPHILNNYRPVSLLSKLIKSRFYYSNVWLLECE